MKRFRWILTLLLAVAMLTAAPVQTFAAGQTRYVSEIRIGYGDEGKAALVEEGFTVWTNLNANEGGNGSAVWVGYQTTTDKSKAITDVALMNMKGGYSFDAYTAELEELNRKISVQLANFEATIEEFRANYAEENLFAQKAYEVMNVFTDDDTLDENGNPVPLGDILLDENTSEETLHRIFLEGNSEAIRAVESALATACIELGDETVLTRLEESEYPTELDPAGNAGRSNLMAVFDSFHSDAISAQQVYTEAEEYEGGQEAFLESETLSDEERYAYITQITRYELLDSIPFGDSGMTLLEFALLDQEEENENGEVLEDEYLDMLAQAMTPGQLGIVANVGIMTILVNAMAKDKADEAAEMFDEYAETELQETISVYYGVDRSLFSDIDSVALTSSALREKAASEASSLGKDSGADKTKAVILTAAAAASLTIGAITTFAGLRSVLMTSQDAFADILAEVGEQAVEAVSTSAVSLGGIIATAIGVVALLAGVILTIFAILQWIEKPKVVKTEYTQIPRVIVDKLDNNGGYVNYYAAGLAGAAEGETDSTKLYGDLNGLNGKDEWVALYYTKNPNMGSPLTDEIFVSSSNTLNTSKAENYTAVHMFGIKTAANLNQYNTKSGAKGIYLFFRNTNDSVGQTGTVFTSGGILTNVIMLLAGGALATMATYIAMKKKNNGAVKKAH